MTATPSAKEDFSASQFTGLILAGGEGRRMGGLDKGLQPYQGRPLVAHALDRLGPQVGRLLISANRNLDHYRAFGPDVLTDQEPGFAGPLAGLEAGLGACAQDWLAVVPCDSPHLPADLVMRLYRAAVAAGAPAAWARSASGSHPVFMLCHRRLLDPLRLALARGERRVGGWLQQIGGIPVAFEDDAAFANFNQLADLTASDRPLPPHAKDTP